MDNPFAAMRRTTTLIGYHGAGLSWARMLPPDSAEIQVPSTILFIDQSNQGENRRALGDASRLLYAPIVPLCDQVIGFPCAYESYSPMKYSKRYAILPAEWRTAFASEADANEFCDAVRRFDAKRQHLTKSESGLIGNQSIDVRQYNATVDIPDLIRIIQRLDPILNLPERCVH